MTSTNRKAVFGLSLGHFVTDLYASALVPLYPLITGKLGITLASISLILSLGHLTSSMLQPLFGYFADRMTKRFFMIIGLILGAVFIPLTIRANSPVLLCMFLMIGMCGNALFHPQVTSLVKTFCFNNPDITKYMGVFMGLGTIGYSLGPVISSFLVGKFGSYAMSYITFIGLFCAFVLYFIVPKIPHKPEAVLKSNFFEIMKQLLGNKVLVTLALIATVKSGVSISFGTYIPFILKDYGYNLNATGIIVTLFFALSGFSMIISSKLENKIGAVNIIRTSFFAILPLVILFYSVIKIFPLLGVIIFIISGFFINLSVSVTIVAAQRLMSKNIGVISGVMQGFSWGLGALSLAPLGYLGEKFGIFVILFIMSFVAFLTGIFALNKDVRLALSNNIKNC